jgi:FkbM family methyltransferase
MVRKNVGCTIRAVGSALLRLITQRPLPRTVAEWRHVDCSFSQFAEDLLVLRALETLGKTEIGYYVDVGAFDPLTYSNTLRLHWRGWQGVNIDAQFKHVARFNAERPDDINLHLAVSGKQGIAEFLCYDSGTTGRLAVLNETSSKSIMGEEVREVIRVPTETLAAVLTKHAPSDRPFGFLSVDCEGADIEVLRSNDWTRFKPWIIAVEDHAKYQETEIDNFCRDHGYQLFAKAHLTKIFVEIYHR